MKKTETLTFTSLREWRQALPELSRHEICLLNKGMQMGLEVFKPSPATFVEEWVANYHRTITQISNYDENYSGWRKLSAAVAGYFPGKSRSGHNHFYPRWHQDEVERRGDTREGKKIVLARLTRGTGMAMLTVFDATSLPQGGELFIEAREGGWWLREKDSSFRVYLGDSPSEVQVMRAMLFLQAQQGGLHDFNAAAVLDWIFIQSGTDILERLSSFLYEVPGKANYKQLKELLGLSWCHSSVSHNKQPTYFD